MKKNENTLSVLIKAGMPLIAIAGLVLSQFVTFGAELSFSVTDTTKMVVCAVALFFFYVPIRDIFLQYFNGAERTTAKKKAYETSAEFVCDNRTKAFKEFCNIEFGERKRRVVDMILRNTEYNFDSFQERYHFDKEKVKSDTVLTKRERRAMLCAIREEKRIKPESVDTILPSGKKHTNEHRRVTSNPDGVSRRTMTFKAVTGVISCVVFVSIGLSLVDGTQAVEVVTMVVMLVGLCLWQAFSAYTCARKINNEYCNQLSEKTMFLLEFEEYIQRCGTCGVLTTEQHIDVLAEPYTVTITKNE